MTKSEELLLGAHTSISGGLHNALEQGKKIGATTVQIFTANQRQWKSKSLTEEGIQRWKEALEEAGLRKIMSHDSYLINLGCPKDDLVEKSRNAFSEEIDRCLLLGISYLNFHPGSALDQSREQCLDRIVESLLGVKDKFHDESLRLLLETTAGQGSTVGCSFEELNYIIERVKGHLPIGVCIDTCHIFAAGYDLASKSACEATFEEFDKVVGWDWLYALHLNDSLKEVGSRVDRHKPLGEGEIGMQAFEWLMQHPRTRELPKYLETPGGDDLWVKEIAKLRALADHKNS